MKALPRDATPVDFAYAIHTDVGHQCVGARVNGKMVPLRARLRNGDIVEIVTTPGHKPSRDWLNFVVTSRARNKIKHFIHAEEKERSLELGRKLFEKEAKRFGLNLKNLTEPETMARVLDRVRDGQGGRAVCRARLRQAVGEDGAGASFVPQEELKEAAGERRSPRSCARVLGTGERQDHRPRHRRPDGVPRALLQSDPRREDRRLHHARQGRVGPLGRVLERRSTCSTTPSGGSTSSGTRATDGTPYTVRLTIQVEDRKGILADVSSKIAGINTNIRNVEATVDDQMGRIDMTVEISDVKHLQKVIKSLRSVAGVVDVERASAEQASSLLRSDGTFGIRQRPVAYSSEAMTSISTRASFGSRATCTVARAGAGAVK